MKKEKKKSSPSSERKRREDSPFAGCRGKNELEGGLEERRGEKGKKNNVGLLKS